MDDSGFPNVHDANSMHGFLIAIKGLYQITLDNSFSESLNVTLHPKMGLKRNRTSESSSFLWHKRLGHISRERVNLIVKEEILRISILLILRFV